MIPLKGGRCFALTIPLEGRLKYAVHPLKKTQRADEGPMWDFVGIVSGIEGRIFTTLCRGFVTLCLSQFVSWGCSIT